MKEWVIVSPHRTQRPWQGQVEREGAPEPPAYDPQCYLCPGNARAGEKRNPAYTSTFVFENDFPALMPDASAGRFERGGLLQAESESGICRVVCFSPRHDLTLARMSPQEVGRVAEVWVEQYSDLGAMPEIRYVQIFENRGAMMGASNPHPHCQVWANQTIPNGPAREQESLHEFRAKHGACLLCRYLELERGENQRMICENEGFVALVPFWAVWPFEVMVLSRRHIGAIDEFTAAERGLFADILRRMSIRYDNLFETAFPNSMGIHQRPTDGQAHPEWHVHAHFLPPLLRSAAVRKFLVGYELLATPQRDITPEVAAERLRSLSEVHYRDRAK